MPALAAILAIIGLIAVGCFMLGIAWVFANYLERRTGEKLRPKPMSDCAYGDGVTVVDFKRPHNARPTTGTGA